MSSGRNLPQEGGFTPSFSLVAETHGIHLQTLERMTAQHGNVLRDLTEQNKLVFTLGDLATEDAYRQFSPDALAPYAEKVQDALGRHESAIIGQITYFKGQLMGVLPNDIKSKMRGFADASADLPAALSIKKMVELVDLAADNNPSFARCTPAIRSALDGEVYEAAKNMDIASGYAHIVELGSDTSALLSA